MPVGSRGPEGMEAEGSGPAKSTLWGRIRTRVKMFQDQTTNLGLERMLGVSLVSKFKREIIFFHKDLRKPLPEVDPIPELTWRKVGEEDAGLMKEINPALVPGLVGQRLARGELGWIFFFDRTPAHYLWQIFETTYLDYLGLSMSIGRGEVLHQSAFTRREFRRMGISSYARIQMFAFSREQGFHRSMASVAWWNHPSSRGLVKRCQMEPFGSVIRWGWGSLATTKTTGHLVTTARGELRVDLP